MLPFKLIHSNCPEHKKLSWLICGMLRKLRLHIKWKIKRFFSSAIFQLFFTTILLGLVLYLIDIGTDIKVGYELLTKTVSSQTRLVCINDPLCQTHSHASNDHFYYLNWILFWVDCKGRNNRRTTCVKIVITVGRPRGSMFMIFILKFKNSGWRKNWSGWSPNNLGQPCNLFLLMPWFTEWSCINC